MSSAVVADASLVFVLVAIATEKIASDHNYGRVPDQYRALRTDLEAVRRGISLVGSRLEVGPGGRSAIYDLDGSEKRVAFLKGLLESIGQEGGVPPALRLYAQLEHLRKSALDRRHTARRQSQAMMEITALPEPSVHFDAALEDEWLWLSNVVRDDEALAHLAYTFRSHRGSDAVMWRLLDFARYASSENVRRAAIMSLGKQFDDNPLTRALLLDAKHKDPAVAVRSEAKALLDEIARSGK